MEAVLEAHPGVWLAFHLAGILLAISSRSRLRPLCAFCTCVLLSVSMVVVGIVAAVGFISQQPFWAASGCTLGFMAVVLCAERAVYEPDHILQAISQSEDSKLPS